MKQLKNFVIFFLIVVPGFAQEYETGNLSRVFTDPERNNRQIPAEIFYPSEVAGTNTEPAAGRFPLIVFGHGFAMNYNSYSFLWEALVPYGYILAFPKTESSIIPFPSHEDLALDMAFLNKTLKAETYDSSALLYGRILPNSALMGHSMGGGAALLAASGNEDISAVVGFASAETNPSAVAAAENVDVSVLIFSGGNDCVTPPEQHQIPMYDNLPQGQKILVEISGGGHCYFADYNFFCAIGENSCSPSPAISREEQQQAVLSLLLPFLNFRLLGSYQAWDVLSSALQNSPGMEVTNGWEVIPEERLMVLDTGWNALAFDPPPINPDFITIFGEAFFSFSFFQSGETIFTEELPDNFLVDSGQACLIKIASAGTISYAGFPGENRSFVLEPGWNMMPVLSNNEIAADQLFGAANLPVYLREIFALGVLWPEAGIYKPDTLQPRKVYWVLSDEEREIVFP